MLSAFCRGSHSLLQFPFHRGGSWQQRETPTCPKLPSYSMVESSLGASLHCGLWLDIASEAFRPVQEPTECRRPDIQRGRCSIHSERSGSGRVCRAGSPVGCRLCDASWPSSISFLFFFFFLSSSCLPEIPTHFE